MNHPSTSHDSLNVNLNKSPLVTREKLHARAKELAMMASRSPENVSQLDYEEAKRELTGESDPDRQEAKLESLPPEPSSDSGVRSAGQPPTLDSGEDRDNDKRLEMDRLVQRSAGEAQREQTLEAANESAGKQP